MVTSSNGNSFRVTDPLRGEFTDHQWIPLTKASDTDVFFDPFLNKRLSKQSLGWWFETQSCPLWRHCNVNVDIMTSPCPKWNGGLLKDVPLILWHNVFLWKHFYKNGLYPNEFKGKWIPLYRSPILWSFADFFYVGARTNGSIFT